MPPDVPQIDAITLAADGFVIALLPEVDADTYEFQVNAGSGLQTQQDTAALSYSAIGILTTGEEVTSDTVYPYRFRAHNADGPSAWSDTFTLKTDATGVGWDLNPIITTALAQTLTSGSGQTIIRGI